MTIIAKKKSRKAAKKTPARKRRKPSDEAIAAFADLEEVEGHITVEALIHPGISVVSTVTPEDVTGKSGTYWDYHLMRAIRKRQEAIERVAAPMREAIQPLLSATLPPVSAEDEAAMGPSPKRVSLDERGYNALLRERDRYKRALRWYENNATNGGRARAALKKEGRR